MIYLTGDIHGSPYRIVSFCRRVKPTQDDIIVILGDVGTNYFLDGQDSALKRALNLRKPTIFCIHGNHEARSNTIQSYELTDFCGGKVWMEKKYPHLLFARDGDVYELEGYKCIVLGGAYSVDKYYRIEHGMAWWADEQMTEEAKVSAEDNIKSKKPDIVLSHTCPFKYIPQETFLSGIDQSSVDNSTEKWLDIIDEKYEFAAWFCGHWHIDKRIDKMHFLFDSFESL